MHSFISVCLMCSPDRVPLHALHEVAAISMSGRCLPAEWMAGGGGPPSDLVWTPLMFLWQLDASRRSAECVPHH